jgi:hypothetical protein
MSKYPVAQPAVLFWGIRLDTAQRPSASDMGSPPYGQDVLYVHSYLLMRTVVGAIGVALPLALMIFEGFFTKAGLRPRGSLSAYYHTTAGQDLFVGGLFTVGIMLITYMSGQPKTADFIASTIAGGAMLGVVFFPTNRADLPAGAPLCGQGSVPEPPSCSPTESRFGETTVAHLHLGFATVSFAFLAILSLVFARRAALSYLQNKPPAAGQQRTLVRDRTAEVARAKTQNLLTRIRGFLSRTWTLARAAKGDRDFDIYVGSFAVIAGAGIWYLVGIRLGSLSALYVTEVVSLLSFGVAWFTAGEGLQFLKPPGMRQHPGSD